MQDIGGRRHSINLYRPQWNHDEEGDDSNFPHGMPNDVNDRRYRWRDSWPARSVPEASVGSGTWFGFIPFRVWFQAAEELGANLTVPVEARRIPRLAPSPLCCSSPRPPPCSFPVEATPKDR